MELSPEEHTRQETKEHINNVRMFLENIMQQIIMRAKEHDGSKLEEPEFSIFVEYTPRLKNSTYGSDEYKEFLKGMSVALDHHYKNNRHHPEHFSNGIDGMNLVDLIELFSDWKSSSLRHDNGDINKSIEINTKRFNMSPQLVNIFKNSIKLFK